MGVLVAAALALGVSACGGGEGASTTTEASTAGSSTSAAPTTARQGARPGPKKETKAGVARSDATGPGITR